MNLTQFAEPSGPPKTLWLTSCPCVGSTWLTRLIHGTLRWHKIWPMPRVFSRREQDIHVNRAFEHCRGNLFVPQTHTKWNEVSRSFVKDYDVHVVILTRNIEDNVVATVDHLNNIGVNLPTAYIPDSFTDLTAEQQYTAVIRYMVPWNVSFYVSWAEAEKQGVIPLYIDYNDLVRDPVPELAKIIAHVHESRNLDQIHEAIKYAEDRSKTRFNIGLTGRGASILNGAQKAEIEAMMSGWPQPNIQAALSRISPKRYEIDKLESLRQDHPGGQPQIPKDTPKHSKVTHPSNKERASRRLRSDDPGVHHTEGGPS